MKFLFIPILILIHSLSALSVLPDTSEYVKIVDGHLWLKGERVRYWGAIGTFPGKNYDENRQMTARLNALGFNAIRSFNSPADFWNDPEGMDRLDHFFSEISKADMKIWFAGLERKINVRSDDVSVIDEPETADQWQSAIKELKQRNPLCHVWDPRMRAVYLREKLRVLDHFNPYTGCRYADDPVFYAWELTNEDWWFHRMKRGQFLGLPQFFLNELYAQWNQFLEEKYGSTSILKKAWIGNLLPDESIENQSVLLLPLLNDITDEQAASLGVKIDAGSIDAGYSSDHFNGKRAGDVISFLLQLWIDYKQYEADAVKAAGLSTKYGALVWENGIGWDLQTQYMQQHADAISHDSYWNGTFHTDTTHKRFPWISQLEELPKLSWNLNPWLEHNRMEGKPFFVYETQIMQPAKYRAEYPMEVVKLASIQDWDVINWHYWGHARSADDENPYDQKLDYVTKSHYPQGYHYQFDEVQQSAMTAAGTIFKNFLLQPAAEPTRFIYGKKSLLSWDMNDYGDKGRAMLPTTYRYGMRLLIDPTREDDEIIGPYIQDRGVYEPCPIQPTEQIAHDWQKGFLTFDAPGVAMFTGFLAQYGNQVVFKNNITLSNVKVLNPPDMPYPVMEDEKYIAFSMVSSDGKPLEQSDEIYVSLVSTSFNSGFRIDEKLHANREFSRMKEWHWDINSIEHGSMPVLVARVGATIHCPPLNGLNYEMYDWHFNTLEKGKITGGKLIFPADKEVFLIRLTR